MKSWQKNFAIDHIVKFIDEIGEYDYYTDPEYGIIAVEDKMGENKKTIRISKKEMEQLHDKGDLLVNDVLLKYKEDIEENLDYNDIAQTLRDQLNKKNSRKYSKDEIFKEINRRKDMEHDRRDKENEEWANLWDEEDLEEATGAVSAGAFEAPLGGKEDIVKRSFAKTDLPVSVNGINKPIGKMYSFNASDKSIRGGRFRRSYWG